MYILMCIVLCFGVVECEEVGSDELEDTMQESAGRDRGSDQGGIEVSLVSVWSDALRIEPDQIQTDLPFVSLGGDSLSAMLCISRVRALFSIDLDIVDFFEDESSIQDFANRIAGFAHSL